MRRTLVGAVVFGVFSLVLLGGPAANAAFPGDNGVIAFTRFTHGQNDIWAVQPDSTGTRWLTKTRRADESFPDWNAAGTQVVFGKCAQSEFGNCDIWVMDADGGNKTRLTNTPDAQETWPAWSPDGTQIAFTSNISDTFQNIWVMDANGSNRVRLTTTNAFDAFPEVVSGRIAHRVHQRPYGAGRHLAHGSRRFESPAAPTARTTRRPRSGSPRRTAPLLTPRRTHADSRQGPAS